MAHTEIINIVGITAYLLLAVFFLWVSKIPNSTTKVQYWLFAILCMLAGRLNLYFLPGILEKPQIQAVYALALTIEKVFLIIGIFFFVKENVRKETINKLIVTSATVLFILTLIYITSGVTTLFLGLFSTTQALALLWVSAVIYRHKNTWYLENSPKLIILLIVYALHWLTFPIAKNYPLWLSWGYLFGNILNLIIYFYFSYLVINRFQNRLIKAEQAAQQLVIKAEQANQAKSDFLANMSHEIRTPMNGVLSMLELLSKDEMTLEQKDQVNIALNSGKSLLNIINDILDFSKIEAGKLTIEHISFDVLELLNQVKELMDKSAEDKALSLTLNTPQLTETIISSDPLRLKQILLNLTSNAIKFTQYGGIRIEANITEIHNKMQLTCSVTDTGIGIEQDKIADIFSSFQQEDNSTTRHFGGTGLGLTISKRLCELMNGDIQVTSEKGHGSCFSFTLPINKGKIDKNVSTAAIKETTSAMIKNESPPIIVTDSKTCDLQTSSKPTEEKMLANDELTQNKTSCFNWHNKTKILLVEDNRINQMVAKKVLKQFELTCDVANHGQEAIELLNAATDTPAYTLILMDCQMPVLDGYQTTEAIRRGDCGKSYLNIPIIAMTANAMAGDREKCLNAGMSDYLTKPLDHDLVLAAFNHWIGTQNK